MLQQVIPNFYCECFPHMKGKNHYSVALALIFRQCFYTNNDVTSYILGWMSIILSMVSLFPQIIKNFVLKRAAGLSIHLFLIWFVGDVSNLIGCILTNQLATQLYLAVYYVCMDIIIISQYTFYEFNKKKFKAFLSKLFQKLHITKQSAEPCHEMSTIKETTANNIFNMSFQSLTSHNTTSTSHLSTPHCQLKSHYLSSTIAILLVVQLLISNFAQFSNAQEAKVSYEIPNCSPPPPDNGLAIFAIGTTCSYISCLCYILAMTPQVYKNYKRKSVQGLSILMFGIDTSNQLLYMLSIIVFYAQPNASFDALSVVPYLAGSFFTWFFSVCILFQFLFYKRRNRNDANVVKEHDATPSHVGGTTVVVQ
ncbi:hypothetical protein C9374_004921 [Naegleria lovaniensis]|uniref:Uncharacterized protein n=1 Tax=Naegleria lovaniensis TaxID=51637 RepID=A0AA88KIL7_NAELO|nr:uncharacterized protein C9374_004921 [Naegleria lovaniensis]KAG2382954.1 hypothetical protein C9374_004921 [Naegleria lovaniensis]